MHVSMVMNGEFNNFLSELREGLRASQWGDIHEVRSPWGVHGVMYEVDEDGDEYATVGFVLPDGVYAEIEDGTYGQLQGFRIYKDDSED